MDADIVRNLDRARVYGLLANLFAAPRPGRADELRRSRLPDLHQALQALGASEELLEIADVVAAALHRAGDDELVADWEANFEPTSRFSFPPIEAAPRGMEAWVNSFRVADPVGFERATEDRNDPLGEELEFLHTLALKEAIAQDEGNAEASATCREAADWFLEEHLGRRSEEISKTLSEAGVGQIYPAASALLGRFVAMDRAARVRLN